MSDFMSLTAVPLADLKDALANLEVARTKLDEAVKEATPKYKDTLNLRWWNVFKKRKTSEQLLRDDYNSSWWITKASLLYYAGLIPKGVNIYANDHCSAFRVVSVLVKSNMPSFHVSEDLLHFINKWKTKEV